MKNNKKITIILSIIGTLIILMGSVYAFFTYSKSANAFTLTSNSITATFTSGNNQINFNNAYPISDEYALQNIDKLDYIDFTVSGNVSNNSEAVGYEIFLTEANGNTLSSNYVKLYLTDNNNNQIVEPSLYSSLNLTTYPNEPTGKVIYKTKTKGETKQYRLYCWLDKDFEDNSISRTFSFYVNLYAYNDNIDNLYTVTFDANGGDVDIDSKEVIYHENYGKLPTPEREGYTFLGWNGKNMLNKKDSLIEGIRNETETIEWYSTAFDNSWVVNTLKPTFEYTISYSIKCIDIPYHTNTYSNNLGFYLFNRTSSSIRWMMTYYIQKDESLEYNNTFITPSDVNDSSANYNVIVYTNLYLDNEQTVISKVKFSNIQLEEGSEATEYEPYYITSDTKVVQNKDHTLKAIWKENE